MSVIAPSITVETEEDFKASVERVMPFAQRVHIDVSDGEFSPVFMVGVDKIWWPREWTVDIHAMVMRPIEYVDKLISLRPNLITFHAEANADLLPILENIKKHDIKAGIAMLKTTVPNTVTDLIKMADHVLIFSGDLGHYGGVASLMQLEKIRLVKAINPNVEIGWDGGVSVDNAFTLAQGNVDVLNVGGALANADDPAKVYDTLISEINKQGVI
ncbi:MAG: ribulose-phosphate 3-epimerase [Patescibacteria group bacterium]|nr:ribulose-phosphate 3-epimerase [Patescibacteria group bacterium]